MPKSKASREPLFLDRVQLEPLSVARSVAPDLYLLSSLFERVCAQGRYSNYGVLHQEYAAQLGSNLGCEKPLLFANATMALTTTLRALNVCGEVVTTAFSFAASAHAITWAGARPVFCDIDTTSLTLDPARVEAAITPRTSAILAVHIYGQPCDHEALQRIATRHKLALIYDAAHAFCTTANGEPIHRWGDATIYSLHASKLTHCGEGGVLVANSAQLRSACEQMQNFGIADESTVSLCGSNGKFPEASAALGLAVLPGVEIERAQRKLLRERYRQALASIDGVDIFDLPPGVEQSEQYFVIRINNGNAANTSQRRDAAFSLLRTHNIFARRYFYPLCSDFPHYRAQPDALPHNLPLSHRAAREMLCLPFHGGVTPQAVDDITFLIRQAIA